MSQSETHLSQCGDDKSERQSNLRDARLVAVAPSSCARDSDGHQEHRSEELSDEHSPYVSVVCDVLNSDDFLHSCETSVNAIN